MRAVFHIITILLDNSSQRQFSYSVSVDCSSEYTAELEEYLEFVGMNTCYGLDETMRVMCWKRWFCLI